MSTVTHLERAALAQPDPSIFDPTWAFIVLAKFSAGAEMDSDEVEQAECTVREYLNQETQTMNRNFVFAAKETCSGEPWLLLELDDDIGLGESHFMMRCHPGASLEDVQTLARTLNNEVASVDLQKL